MRDENLETSTLRVRSMFERLAKLAPEWEEWYLHPKTLEMVNEPVVSNNVELIRQELLSSQEESDDGSPMDSEMGYLMGASSKPMRGSGLERSHFHVHCCSRTRFSGFNTLSIQLPTRPSSPHLYERDLLCQTVSVLADIWEPEWLSVRDLLTNLMPQPWPPWPAFGWVNYLAERSGIIPDPLPAQWEWFEQRGKKQVFIYLPGLPQRNNSEHSAAFNEIFEMIRWKK